MRRRVLLVAAELDFRARYARELHSSGYTVELACDMKRSLTLAADTIFGWQSWRRDRAPPAWR